MKIVNGKLLGKPQSDLDLFKESQNLYNSNIDRSMQELDRRVERTENGLEGEALREAILRRLEQYIETVDHRCDRLEKERERSRIVEQRWKYIEDTKLSQIETNLLKVKQLIPHKLLWLTFCSSLVVGTISVFSWLNVISFKQKPKEVIYNQSNSNEIDSRVKKTNPFELKKLN